MISDRRSVPSALLPLRTAELTCAIELRPKMSRWVDGGIRIHSRLADQSVLR